MRGVDLIRQTDVHGYLADRRGVIVVKPIHRVDLCDVVERDFLDRNVRRQSDQPVDIPRVVPLVPWPKVVLLSHGFDYAPPVRVSDDLN
ncbi:MAG: hypothetical protein QOF21_505 [Actinomycetota bacterium]